MITEQDGKVSFSRITGAVIVVANLASTILAAYKGSTPVLADIPLNWAMLVGALYGLNVLKNKG
jgi:hypothetical protein